MRNLIAALMLVIVTSGCEKQQDKNRALFYHYCEEQDKLRPYIEDAMKYSLPLADKYIRRNKQLVDSMDKYYFLVHPEQNPIHKTK